MSYLIYRILFWLLSAGLLGFLIGWWWTRQTERRRSMELEGVWTQKVQRSNRELDAIRSDLRTEATRTQTAMDAENALKARLISTESEHQAALDKLASVGSRVAASDRSATEIKGRLTAEIENLR